MWCLETIKEINREVASGKTLDQAYANCGIVIPGRILPAAEVKVEEKAAREAA
jgi:hypothetical protein